MNPIDIARQALIDQLNPIEQEEVQLQDRLDQLKATKAPIVAAIKVIDAAQKTKPKASNKSSRSSPKQKDVRDVCLALVAANPGIDKNDLEALAKQKLTEELGFDLKGFARRLGEVLGSKTLVVAEDGSVAIARPESDAESPRAPLRKVNEARLPVEHLQEVAKVD